MEELPGDANENLPEGGICERTLFVIDEMIAGSVQEMDQHEQGTQEWSFWNGSGNALLQLRSFVADECNKKGE